MYPKIKNAVLLCLLLAGTQLAGGFAAGIFFGLFGLDTESTLYGIVTIFINLASFGLVIIIGFRKSKQKFNEVFRINSVSPDYWLAVIVFMAGFIIVLSEIDNILNFILPMPEFLSGIFETLMVKQVFAVAIILIGIIPAITEEMLFRGLILKGFTGNYSDKKAIVTSALLFGIIHLNPWQFLTAFIIGIIMAWICIRTKSIILCMYMHLFNNVVSLLSVRYKDALPIRGFNMAYSEQTFQPLWFDLAGILLTAAGILLLMRAVKKEKIAAY